MDLPTLIAAVLPGVTNITVTRFEPEPHALPGEPTVVHQSINYGSGFVIDPSGLIVTNRHLIDGAETIVVVFQDGIRLRATVLGMAQRLDVALLRVAPTEKLTALQFG